MCRTLAVLRRTVNVGSTTEVRDPESEPPTTVTDERKVPEQALNLSRLAAPSAICCLRLALTSIVSLHTLLDLPIADASCRAKAWTR